MPVYIRSFAAKLKEKTLANSKYLVGMMTFPTFREVIKTF